MKKALFILLAFMVLSCFAACDVTPAAVDDIPSDSYPDNGRDVAYDVGQLDILNKLRAVKDAGKADDEPYALGSVTEFHTLSENGSEFILANVLRHTKEQENYGGLVDEYCWIIHELGTQNYTWLKSNAELLDFTSANEISFQTGYNSESPYYSFPYKSTFVNTGSRWAVFGDTVWLKASTPSEFGPIAFKEPDGTAQAELKQFPFSLSEVYFTPNSIGLVTSGGAGNDPVPYMRIDSIESGKTKTVFKITLQNCALTLLEKAAPPDYAAVSGYEVVQEGENTIVNVTLSYSPYLVKYNVSAQMTGSWYAGNGTEIQFDAG